MRIDPGVRSDTGVELNPASRARMGRSRPLGEERAHARDEDAGAVTTADAACTADGVELDDPALPADRERVLVVLRADEVVGGEEREDPVREAARRRRRDPALDLACVFAANDEA